jgi:hypothetical protein
MCIRDRSYYALKNLFTILAGRFQTSAPVMGIQSEVLVSEGNSDYKYIIDSIRHLGLDVETVDASPLFMVDEKIVPASGNYFSVPSEENKIDGGKLIHSMAFSKLVENLPEGLRWDQLTGTQNQGNQAEALALIVKSLEGVEPNSKVMIKQIMNGQELPLKSVRNVIRRLEGFNLLEYHSYHGGYMFKPEVAGDIEFLKNNWQSLRSGELALIGIRSSQFPGENEAHRNERVARTQTIISAYNEFVELKGLKEDEAVEFTATDLIRFIRGNQNYSEAGITPADLQVFIRRLSDSERGAVFEEDILTEKEPDYIYTKKEYLSACKQAIAVDEKQVLLYRRLDFSKQPEIWPDFITSLETNSDLETSYRLALYLYENSGQFVTKEELNEAMKLLCVECDKKGFHTRYMDAQDPEKNLAGYIQTKGEEENAILSKINSAFVEANDYANELSHNIPLLREMFEKNILYPGNKNRGETIGIHKLRENAAKVLINFLVSYRKKS